MARTNERVASRDRRWPMVALSVAFLVWHLFTCLVIGAYLVVTTLLFAGTLVSDAPLPESVPILGVPVGVVPILVVLWVLFASLLVAGISLSIGTIRLRRHPERLGGLIVLARVMFGLCVLLAVSSLVQRDLVTFFCSLYSGLLTGLLALGLRRVEERSASPSGLTPQGSKADEATLPENRVPKQSFVAKGLEGSHERAHAELVGEELRESHGFLSGYATTMLVWGALRALMGLSVLFGGDGPIFSVPTDAVTGILASPGVEGILLIAYGVYLFLVGRVGKRVVLGDSNLGIFRIMCGVGLVLAVATVALYAVLLALGAGPVSGDLFVSVLDALLYVAGLFYGSRLLKGASL